MLACFNVTNVRAKADKQKIFVARVAPVHEFDLHKTVMNVFISL
jgi:hypothetical protein